MKIRKYPQKKKKCTKCRKIKSSLHFYIDVQKKDGFTSSCHDCVRKTYIENKNKHLGRRKKYSQMYYVANREKLKKWFKQKWRTTMMELFNLLGNKCVLCGENDKKILAVDHINGGGNKERKIRSTTYRYYSEMIESIKNKETKYRLLCSNCNLREAFRKGHKITIWK